MSWITSPTEQRSEQQRSDHDAEGVIAPHQRDRDTDEAQADQPGLPQYVLGIEPLPRMMLVEARPAVRRRDTRS